MRDLLLALLFPQAAADLDRAALRRQCAQLVIADRAALKGGAA